MVETSYKEILSSMRRYIKIGEKNVVFRQVFSASGSHPSKVDVVLSDNPSLKEGDVVYERNGPKFYDAPCFGVDPKEYQIFLYNDMSKDLGIPYVMKIQPI